MTIYNYYINQIVPQNNAETPIARSVIAMHVYVSAYMSLQSYSDVH